LNKQNNIIEKNDQKIPSKFRVQTYFNAREWSTKK